MTPVKPTVIKAKSNLNQKIYTFDTNVNNGKIVEAIASNISNRERCTNVKADLTGWHFECEIANLACSFAQKIAEQTYQRKYKPLITTECWGILYKEGDFAKPHNHYGNIWSGVYYPMSNNSNLFFTDLDISITPKEGMLVLFESYIRHEVLKVENERLAVSFNLDHEHEQI